jgi:hypothetical protein
MQAQPLAQVPFEGQLPQVLVQAQELRSAQAQERLAADQRRGYFDRVFRT